MQCYHTTRRAVKAPYNKFSSFAYLRTEEKYAKLSAALARGQPKQKPTHKQQAMSNKPERPALRSDGKPRATPEQITAARRKAAAARWKERKKAEWRTVRIHSDTYAKLEDERKRKRATWDGLFAFLLRKR